MGCLVAVFAYGVVWIGGESVVTNFELAAPNFSQQGPDNRENTSRKQIWASTWQAFKANPIAGVGAGGYWIAIRKYHDATGDYTPQEAHNDYLELLASGGIIGAVLVIWFIVVFLSRARQSLKSLALRFIAPQRWVRLPASLVWPFIASWISVYTSRQTP